MPVLASDAPFKEWHIWCYKMQRQEKIGSTWFEIVLCSLLYGLNERVVVAEKHIAFGIWHEI